MNRELLVVLSPFAAVATAILSLLVWHDPSNPIASILLLTASLSGLGLGLFLPELPVKNNRLVARAALYLLAVFNLLVISSIAIAIVALFVLFQYLRPELPASAVWWIWMLPVLLIALQTGVILERRINAPPPHLTRTLLVILGSVTALNLFFSVNAIFVRQTSFLYFTGIELAPSQAVYLLLTGATLQAVTAMIAFRIPTLVEMVFRRVAGPERMVSLTSATPVIFTVAFTALFFIGSILFVFAADEILNLGDFLPSSLALRLVLVFPAALVMFFVVAGFLSYQRSRATFKVKMDAERKRFLGLAAGVALVTLLLLQAAYRLYHGASLPFFGVRIPSRGWVELLVLALLVVTGPIGFYLQAQQRKTWYIEERLGDFLRDLAETSKAGLPLHQSLQSAAEKDYGPLSKEIRRMAIQCSWGLSFAEAFRRFGDRSSSRLVKRAANLVVETSVSGGNSSDILAATAADIQQQKSLDDDRRASMTTYIAVIYIVFFVFLAVLGVLSALFLPQLLGATKAANQAGASSALFASNRIDLRSMKDTYFEALLVQAFGNGLIAGMIRDGSVGTGMKHMFILVVISYVAYRLLFV